MTTQNALNTQLVLPTGSTAINSLLYTSSSNLVSGLSAVNSAAMVTSLTGVPTWLGPLTNGQLIIGSTGAIPVVGTLTAGTNVTISNGAGTITINATGSGSGTVNSGLINQLAYFASAGTAVSGLATANSGVLITSGSGVPSISSTLPYISSLGTIIADNAAAGYVGEVISSVIASGSAVSFANATPKTLTSLTLTAGDWDIWGNFYGNAATYIQTVQGGIHTVTNTLPDGSLQFYLAISASVSAQLASPVPSIRINVSSSTTYYLVASIQGVGALAGIGGLYARRRR